jgi:hypothetical protein
MENEDGQDNECGGSRTWVVLLLADPDRRPLGRKFSMLTVSC